MSTSAQHYGHRINAHLRSAKGKSVKFLARRYGSALGKVLVEQGTPPAVYPAMPAREHVVVSLGHALIEDTSTWYELQDVLHEIAENPRRDLPPEHSLTKLRLRIRRSRFGEADEFEDLPPYWKVYGALFYLGKTGRLPSEDVEEEETT